MTPHQKALYLAAIQSYTKKICDTKETARAALVREGIYLPNGDLNPNYKP